MDEAKNRSNFLKHQVSFELAISAFLDPDRIEGEGRIVNGEQRYYLIGRAASDPILFVVFTWRHYGEEEVCRIISARAAHQKERSRYPGVH